MQHRPYPDELKLDEADRTIINRLQDGLPLETYPFARVAHELGIDEKDLIARTRRLREAGILSRFGPFFDAAAMGGAFCLCAITVPAVRYDEIADKVNAFDEVAHNYERDHTLNMWFVLATETPEGIEATARRIETATGCKVLLFPKLEEYFIGFRVAA